MVRADTLLPPCVLEQVKLTHYQPFASAPFGDKLYQPTPLDEANDDGTFSEYMDLGVAHYLEKVLEPGGRCIALHMHRRAPLPEHQKSMEPPPQPQELSSKDAAAENEDDANLEESRRLRHLFNQMRHFEVLISQQKAEYWRENEEQRWRELLELRSILFQGIPALRQKNQVAEAVEAARYALALFEVDPQVRREGWTAAITTTISELAICLGESRFSQALQTCEEAMSIVQKVEGSDVSPWNPNQHFSWPIAVMRTYANCLMRNAKHEPNVRGKFLSKAEEMFRKSLQLSKTSPQEHLSDNYKATHPDTINVLTTLARCLKMQGPHRLSAAEATLRKAVKAFEVLSGPHHPDTVKTMDTLAGNLVSQQKDDEAVLVFKAMLTRAEEGLEEDEGQSAPDKACVFRDKRSRIITLLMNLDRYEEAVDHATAMLRSSEEFLGPRHADTCKNKALLREVKRQQAQHAKAMKHMVGNGALSAQQLSGDKQGSKKGGSSSNINSPAQHQQPNSPQGVEGYNSLPQSLGAEKGSIQREGGGSGSADSSGSSSNRSSSKAVQSLAGSLSGLSVQEQAQQPQDQQQQSPCTSKKQGESKEGPRVRTCIACHREGMGMKRCSRCYAVWACGPECFAKAWKDGHKRECLFHQKSDACNATPKNVTSSFVA